MYFFPTQIQYMMTSRHFTVHLFHYLEHMMDPICDLIFCHGGKMPTNIPPKCDNFSDNLMIKIMEKLANFMYY